MAGDDKRKAQLEIGVNADPAVNGLRQVGDEALKMGQQVEKGANQASKGMDKLPEQSKKGAEGFDRATKSLINSIQRTTAAMDAGGRSSADYFRLLAQQRGVSTAALDPYLKQLEEVNRRQLQVNGAIAGASRALDGTTTSAKQLNFALRQVPAQFTDIVTSLQGGQPALQVLLQQGGQLKDLFGGVGAAVQALGRYMLTLVTPLNTVLAGLGVLAFGFVKGSQEAQEFQKTLVLTGNSVGLTADRLVDISRSLDNFGTTQAKGAEALNRFAQTGLIAASNLERFALAAIKFEQVGGPAVEDTAKAFEDLGKKPLESAIRLNETTNFLTKSVYEQIKALSEQGRVTEAATVAQNAYADAVEKRTPELVARLGLLERVWVGIKNATKEAGDAILSIGRADTPIEALRRLQDQVNIAGQNRTILAQRGMSTENQDRSIESLNEQIRLLQKAISAEEDRAAAVAKSAKEVKNKIEADKEYEKILKEAESWIKKFSDAHIQAQGAVDGLTKTQETLIEFLTSDAYKKMAEPMRQKALAAAYAAIEIEKQVIAEKELQKANAEATKAEFERTAAYEKAAETAIKNLERIRTENEAYALSIERNVSLAEAIELVTIARLREQQVSLGREGDRDVEILAIQREIDARLAAVSELRQKKIREDIEKSAKAAEEAWKRAAQKIEDSIVDALMRGFERGDGIIENLKRTIENTFKTLVLRPIIQAVVSPFTSSLAGGGAGGISNILSSASGIQSIFSAVTGGLGSSVGTAIANAGSLFGSQALQAFGLGMRGSVLGPGMMGPTTAGASGVMGAGAAFAQVLPYVAAATVAYSALARPGETRAGGQYGFNFGDGLINQRRGTVVGNAALGVNFLEGPSGGATNDQAVRDAITATVGTINSILAGVGSRASLTGFQAGLETSSKGRGGVFAGGALSTGALFGESGQGDNYAGTLFESFSTQSPDAATALKNFSIDLKQATIQALQAATDIPKSIADKIRDVDAEALSEQAANALVEQIAAIVDSVSGLKVALAGLPFEDVKNLSFDASVSLIEFAGGLDKLTGNLATYYDNFFTAAEKQASLQDQIGSAFDSLNLALPETRQQFRDLVEAQDLSTEAGRKNYAALLSLSGAFATLTQGADELAQASRRTAEQIASERTGLETRLLQIVGNTQELRARELATIDESNRALQERIWLIEDQIEADQRAIQSAEAALSGAKTATDAAFSVLQASVNAQKQAVQASIDAAKEQIDAANGLISLLRSATRDLRGQDISAAGSARSFLTQSIETARTTGYLPDQADLSSAIETIRRDIDTTNYATAFEARRDRLLLTNQFEELAKLAEDQMTEAEKQLKASEDQLKALDEVVKNAQDQLNALRGIDTSVKSVEQAIAALSASIEAERAATAQLAAAQSAAQANAAANRASVSSTVPSVQQTQSSSQPGPTVVTATSVADLYRQVLGREPEAAGSDFWNEKFGNYVDRSERELFLAAARPELAVTGQLSRVFAFAEGGMHTGGLRIVGERGPEIEATGPAMYWNASQTARMLGGGNMSDEIRGLREEVAMLRYETRATAVNTAKTSKVLERVTRDGESLLVTNA
jgi:hypothetical protein